MAPAQGNPVARTALRVALSLGVLALLLVLAEVAWRFHLQGKGLGWRDDPREFTSPFFTTYEEPRPFSDQDGFEFHNGWISRTKSPDELRVICFGGSTTVNRREGTSYAQLLEQRLSKAALGRTVRVLNAGGDGFSTAHVLVNLALRNLEAQPDVITVYENINDLSAIHFGARTASDYANKYHDDFYLGMRHRTGFIAELTKISRLARSAVHRVHALRFPEPESGTAQDWRPVMVHYERNLRSIVAVARAHGIAVVLATQPASAQLRADPGFSAFNEVVRRLAAELDVPLVDVAAQVQDEACFLPDQIHYTPAGVRAVADAFEPVLANVLAEVAGKL